MSSSYDGILRRGIYGLLSKGMRRPFKNRIYHVVAKRHNFEVGSLMRKMQDFIVLDKRIFIGLEDSKQTWKILVLCEGRWFAR